MFRFLKNLIFPESQLLRPPGALQEDEFIDRCIKCNKCGQVCPFDSVKVLQTEAGIKNFGTPVIEARRIPCYVCMKCPPVCPTGALDNSLEEKENIRMGKAKLNEQTCLPYKGIICRACFENCPIFREAIILEDEMYPKVIEDKCVGCGICEHVCPVEGSAIIVESANTV